MKIHELWTSLRNDFEVLRHGEPGHRFRGFRDVKKSQAEPMYSIARVFRFILGFLLIFVGLAIGWLPGPGGFLAFIGIAMIADAIPGAAAVLDWGELAARKTWRWFRRQSLWFQISIYTACLASSAFVFWTIFY